MRKDANRPVNPVVASPLKIGAHKERITRYLDGDSVFPVTLELDLTTECTRACLDCPSTRAQAHHNLDENFLEGLFDRLGGRTRGLLLTGGEPTLAPLFPKALKSARKKGFSEIAVVTNGSLLENPVVSEALLSDVTTIRLSMYDWDRGGCSDLEKTFRRIEGLRKKIDSNGSRLRIGTSVLTSKTRRDLIEDLARDLYNAGAHWLYFHPLCKKWHLGKPTPVDQNGIVELVGSLENMNFSDFHIYALPDRYDKTPLEFTGYHAAHFLLVVGADGKNYLGPEVKYQPDFVIADLKENGNDDFLRQEMRLRKIGSVSSLNYPAIRSRHRSTLYNHTIENLKREEASTVAQFERLSAEQFLFPHIL